MGCVSGAMNLAHITRAPNMTQQFRHRRQKMKCRSRFVVWRANWRTSHRIAHIHLFMCLLDWLNYCIHLLLHFNFAFLNVAIFESPLHVVFGHGSSHGQYTQQLPRDLQIAWHLVRAPLPRANWNSIKRMHRCIRHTRARANDPQMLREMLRNGQGKDSRVVFSNLIQQSVALLFPFFLTFLHIPIALINQKHSHDKTKNGSYTLHKYSEQ